MNKPELIKIFLPTFLGYLPTLIVCLAAGLIILTKWRQAPSGSLWALLGFGLTLILCFAMPIGQAMFQQWLLHHLGDRGSRMWPFYTFGILASVLQALSYVFLLVAILAGRSKPDTAMLPSLNRP
jgi:hypothetical protein